MVVARLILAALVLAITAIAFDPARRLDDLSIVQASSGAFAAFYVLTAVAFAAFPNSRRNDLIQGTLLLGVLGAVNGLGGDDLRRLAYACAAAGGALAVHLPSHLEAMRKRMRETPAATAPAIRADDRARIAGVAPKFRRRRIQPVWLIAWALGAGIVAVTICPQSMRPHLGSGSSERFFAFFVTAAAFAAANPKRPMLVAVGSAVAAVLLELAQFAAPGRDPAVVDAIQKAFGGVAGALTVAVAARVWQRAAVVLLPRQGLRATYPATPSASQSQTRGTA